jgi:hypothetical protein
VASWNAAGVAYSVVVDASSSTVAALSSVRLPFEPKGWVRGFRADLASACRTLTADAGEILHATYTSDDRTPVDVENVLTYNLGTGAVSAAARHGLVLERRFRRVGPTLEEAHHYRYQLTPAEQRWRYWKVGQPRASLRIAADASVFAAGKAPKWWLAAKRGVMTAHVRTARVPERYVLRITVAPPTGWRGLLVNLLKPLTDGVVAALQTHDGAVDDIVLARAPVIDPALTPEEMLVLLTEHDRAPLGSGRLAVARASGVQFLPADDQIVALELRLTRYAEPGTVVVEAADALPAVGQASL